MANPQLRQFFQRLLQIVEGGNAGDSQNCLPREEMDDVRFHITFNQIDTLLNRASHIPDTVTLTKWEETESRRQLTTILEQIESGGAEYLGYLDEYIKDYQERNAADDE